MSLQPIRTTTKGLATVAMLKAHFDAGRDHIAMFQPFVLDAVAHLRQDDLGADEIRSELIARHELALPVNTLSTLLGRVAREGYLRREGGRYFRTAKELDMPDLVEARARAQARQGRLAQALCEAAADRDARMASTEEALERILRFLDQYHVTMAGDGWSVRASRSVVLDEIDDESPQDEQDKDVVTARFLLDTASSSGELTEILQEMLEGFVLQNTLLLKDISTATRRFRSLHVFLDTRVLFSAIGLHGRAPETAVKELLSLLRDTGAVLDVFEPTIREMRRVLTVFENKVATSEGRLSLYPTELTRHILSEQLTPSDVRTRSALIEKDLRALGINIREMPDRVREGTLDERPLGKLLASRAGENEPRVVHDVDCVAGVLIYRRGKTSASLDDAEAVFTTDSGMTVQHVTTWYNEQVGDGVPPIIHYLALSNFAWLKKPASATRLKLDELVALCTAALRPSREAWTKFVDHLKKLEASGHLSSDETTAIIASDLTDRVLLDAGIDQDSDASSLSEVVERVKASYKEEADARVSRAQREAEESGAEASELRGRISTRARTLAVMSSWSAATLLGTAFLVGTVLSVISAATGDSLSLVGLLLAFGPLACAGLAGILWGFNLKIWRAELEGIITRVIERWFAGSES